MDILAKYGYHPDIVEALSARYNKQRNCDFVTFQRKLLENFHAHSFEELRSYKRIFDNRGYLTNKETHDFVEAVSNLQRKGAVNMLFDNSDEMPPAGWAKMKCGNCGEAFAIVKISDEYGKGIFASYNGTRCGKCWSIETHNRGRF